MMRFQVRFIASMAAGLALCGALMTTASAQSSSSSSNSVQQAPPQSAPAPVYVAVDPLAGVRYDNRWDISAGVAYAHIKAGPTLLEGSNLGGGDLSGSYWFARRWGLDGDFRATFGTSGAAPNAEAVSGIHGPFVAQYLFTAGPQWLGPHNKHGALIAHVLVGGAYGDFERDLKGFPPSTVGFYNTQVAPAALFGGHFDLNRSPRWVFRVTTDAVWTRYSTDYATNISPAGGRTNWNYSMAVGMMYKFKKKR
ncbi:MAG TPA: hypothetical protein VF742_06705 [Terracidiphilus sp.]|jgi:hypothetical protein